MKSNNSRVFDAAIEEVITDDAWVFDNKVRFIIECLEDMLMDGWDDYFESEYYMHPAMQEAINKL